VHTNWQHLTGCHEGIAGELHARSQGWADAPTSAQHYRTDPSACQDHRDVVAMPHRTTRTDRCKIYSFLITRLRASLAALGDRAFAATDADARQHGWQVTSAQGGLGRRYRDPRLDTLAVCPQCRGRGAKAPANPCQGCGGTGRVVIEPAADPPSSPPPRG